MPKTFLQELFSGDNSKVNTMAVVSVVLAAPVVVLASAALIYHIFLLKKGLDSPSVQLLIALLTAATGGLGASLFSRSTIGGMMGGGYRDEPPPPPLTTGKPPRAKPLSGEGT